MTIKLKKIMNNLIELTSDEMKSINGGAPTKDTGFWYDLSYYVLTGLMALGEGASKVYG